MDIFPLIIFENEKKKKKDAEEHQELPLYIEIEPLSPLPPEKRKEENKEERGIEIIQL
jgi:hypothetical protein